MSDTLRLEYELHDLPTAFHKAGLAGLVLHIDNLRERGVQGPIPEVMARKRGSAVIQTTREALNTLMDDAYAAVWTETAVKTKWANKQPKRIDEVPGSKPGKTEKRFIYDVCLPTGGPLPSLLSSGPGSPWLKLWRDMLWNVLRAQSNTRIPYEKRASGASAGLGEDMWKTLNPSTRSRRAVQVERLTGSLLPGAQDENAERVPFQGTPKHNFLLHFWSWVSPVFAGRRLKVEDGKYVFEDAGYVTAVPEITDLAAYLALIRQYWLSLPEAMAGYRPRDAWVDMPEEAGLEFAAKIARHRVERQELSDAFRAVDVFQQIKQRNNVRTLAVSRVEIDRRTLDDYELWVKDRNKLSPLYKQLRISNLLRGRLWYAGAAALMSRYPAELFVSCDKTAEKVSSDIPHFSLNVRQQFRGLEEDLEIIKEQGAAYE